MIFEHQGEPSKVEVVVSPDLGRRDSCGREQANTSIEERESIWLRRIQNDPEGERRVRVIEYEIRGLSKVIGRFKWPRNWSNPGSRNTGLRYRICSREA